MEKPIYCTLAEWEEQVRKLKRELILGIVGGIMLLAAVWGGAIVVFVM